VQWVQGADGGSALISQSVNVYSGGRRVGSVSVGASSTGITITGLKARETYRFTVVALNRVGTGPESAQSNQVTPLR
jgi:hypothetical protein